MENWECGSSRHGNHVFHRLHWHVYRAAAGVQGWPSDPAVTHINILAGGINTFVLITSSVFVVLAHEAMHNGKFKLATNWMIATTALAFVFLGIKSVEYYGKYDHDILPRPRRREPPPSAGQNGSRIGQGFRFAAVAERRKSAQ